MKEELKNNQGNMKILVAILVILIIVAGVLFVTKMMKENRELETMVGNNEKIEGEKEEEEKPQPKTFAGNDRPIAFMVDNHIDAMPQAGLEQADLVYEIIVEGGETRLMMLMKNKDVEKIGPLRSARHYYLDYALENDAIYVHYGQSPQAKSDIKTLAISDINGINESETSFWRDNSKYAPHNAVSSIKNINAIIKRENFKTTTTKGNVLNYVAEEVELGGSKEDNAEGENTTDVQENNETAKTAKTVTIPYSTYNTVKYTYNEETKTYKRYSRDTEQKDWNTNKAISVKNIIITKCKNWSIDSYGRQTIDNVKTLDGYYITNGKYIPIKCEKKTRSGKTVYKDLNGKEIEVNDGKTFIQICPIDSEISFK